MATELYEVKRHLRDLVFEVDAFLKEIDEVMKGPSTRERGIQVANLCNRLQIKKDIAERYGLNRTPAPSRSDTPARVQAAGNGE